MKSLLAGDFTKEVEVCVAGHLGKTWQVREVIKSKADAMHEAALFVGEKFSVFVKLGTNPFSSEQFDLEAAGLRYIGAKSEIKTPEVFGVVHTPDGVLLVMEAIDARKPQNRREWEILGEGLARLHAVHSPSCGFETPTYLGIFRQDNTPRDSWEEFYGQVRLRDSLNMAINSGNIGTEQIRAMERLIERVPSLCGPEKPFSLLHGDPWLENLLFDGTQLVLIDCSLYYGNHEMDLSTVDFFVPVDPALFDGYHSVNPIDPGYEGRKDLWRINQWLGHVVLWGERFYPQLMGAVNKYL